MLCELPPSFTTDEEVGHGDSFDFDDDENEAIDDVVLWGSHVPQSDRWDDDTVFDGSNYNPPLMSYGSQIYSVVGHPSLDDDPAYLGHFANDRAGNSALKSQTLKLTNIF